MPREIIEIQTDTGYTRIGKGIGCLLNILLIIIGICISLSLNL